MMVLLGLVQCGLVQLAETTILTWLVAMLSLLWLLKGRPMRQAYHQQV